MVFESAVDKVSAVRDQIDATYEAARTEVLEAEREAQAEQDAWEEDIEGALADLHAQDRERLERAQKGLGHVKLIRKNRNGERPLTRATRLPSAFRTPQPEREAPQDLKKCFAPCPPCPPCHGACQAPFNQNAREAATLQVITERAPPVSEDWALSFLYFIALSYSSTAVARMLHLLFPEITREESRMMAVAGVLIVSVLTLLNGN